MSANVVAVGGPAVLADPFALDVAYFGVNVLLFRLSCAAGLSFFHVPKAFLLEDSS